VPGPRLIDARRVLEITAIVSPRAMFTVLPAEHSCNTVEEARPVSGLASGTKQRY
jgi:hypothetical protein